MSKKNKSQSVQPQAVQVGSSAQPEAVRSNQPAATTPTTEKRGSFSQDEVAAEAYRIYLQEGSREGRDLDNWLKAEQALAKRQGQSNGNGRH